MELTHAGTALLTAFLASLVECVDPDRQHDRRRLVRWDLVGIAASFKAVMLEGAEVVCIVIAVGAVGNALVPASLGAVATAGLVAVLGVLVHRPLARVPENALKFAVSIMLSSFGAFWLGEGYGFSWPGADLRDPWADGRVRGCFRLRAVGDPPRAPRAGGLAPFLTQAERCRP
jgi:hypothetical protein